MERPSSAGTVSRPGAICSVPVGHQALDCSRNRVHIVEVMGLCAVVLGEDGLVWNMRILNDSPLARKYGFS